MFKTNWPKLILLALIISPLIWLGFEHNKLDSIELILIWFETFAKGFEAIRNLLISIGIFSVVFGLYLTWRRLRSIEKQTELAIEERQHDVDKEKRKLDADHLNKATEQFNRAIEQLGSANIFSRISSIQVLVKLTENHPDKFNTTNELFQTFLHNYFNIIQDIPDNLGVIDKTKEGGTIRQVRHRTDDISAILIASNKVFESPSYKSINLKNYSLNKITIENTDFNGSNFHNVSLESATITNCNFTDCDFNYANLRETRFINCNFSGSKFYKSGLQNTELTECDFTNTILHGVNFFETKIYNINISKAHLGNVQNLTQQQLDNSWAFRGSEPNNIPKFLSMNNIHTLDDNVHSPTLSARK